MPYRDLVWTSLTLTVVLGIASTAGLGAGPGGAVPPVAIDKPLIAYWTFDEPLGDTCYDASGNRHDASPDRKGQPGFERMPGLFGTALRFTGRHKLRVPEKPKLGTLPKLSFSAWTMPTAFEKYNEIFRKEDGDHRVLFSYQENAHVLSLGLNVGGYVECDAKIQPEQVLDGQWHHTAATFDGQTMRVYLDGKEIGSLARSGSITAGGLAPGCIGSSGGGECFQGGMDELRIYADALTSDEVAQIYQAGVQALARLSEPVDAGEPQVDAPLVAHWNFNEKPGSPVIQDRSKRPELVVKPKGRILRERGVHGTALELAGTHSLETATGLPAAGAAKLTLAAWAKPGDLSGNRDLFRQDGPGRLLLSFQEDGKVLAAGVTADGYAECDARLDPARVRDGRWHHCAATFDGQTIRVYLDGKEVGSCEQPGKLTVDAEAPAFIGSVGGQSEHFQGGLDDLRIYADALTPEQVAALYQGGAEALAAHRRELDEALATLYAPKETFAETLASARGSFQEKKLQLEPEVTAAFVAKLRAAFPEEYGKFTEWTGASPVDYLVAPGNEFNRREAGRLVEMMLEYRPLTECQIAKETPADRERWAEAADIELRFKALDAAGEANSCSPDWIAVMLEAGSRIQFRPHVSEPVAPYVTPSTPETRDLTAEEARDALHRDWLHQAGNNPTPERIQEEIRWAREMALRIAAEHPGEIDFSSQLAGLEKLEERAAGLTRPDPELYFSVRELKRSMMFANPVLDFDKMLLVDMPFPQGREWPHETRHRLGYQAVPGGKLVVLQGLTPGGHVTQLMPQLPLCGSFWRPDVSFDGTKILVSFKPHNEKAFHLYEINADGTNLVQLTDGIYDDFDPIYLPDGHIMFSTTRGNTYVRCMPPTNAFPLARCDADGKNIYIVSRNNEPDYLPSVMNDGRVIYTRWEYTDKPLWRAVGMWTVNPDGTQVNTFWGNQSVWPDLLKDARSIPGSHRVMFTGSAHHNWFSGSVGIIDPDKGFNFPDGLTKVTADVTWPEVGNGPVDPAESPNYHPSGAYAAYYSPFPLSESDFLVSANRGGKFVLYLMDTDGNRELVYEGVNQVFHAQPLRARPRPPVIADRVDWPTRDQRLHPKPGIIYSSNVYHGAPPELNGKAKYLRVLNIDHKTYTYWHKRPYISTGPVVSMVQSDGVKRVLGTVPIEEDGSVAFKAPSGIPLHFQLLDERYRALQTMRSFTGVMPGERRGCLGCHEKHSTTPELEIKSIALAKPPHEITPPPWGVDTVGYERYVQPVLEKYCGECHVKEHEGKEALDLTLRPGYLMFKEPYVTLTGHPSWGRPYQKPENPPPGFGIAGMIPVEGYSTTDPAAYRTPAPMTYLSYKSPLIDLCSSGGHYDVKVDDVSLRRLIAWVDTMCPYRGEEEVRQIPDPEFQGVDWLAIRPKIQTAPEIVRPGPVD